MKLNRFLIIALAAVHCGEVYAYKEDTHADISKAAANASVLHDNSDTSVLRALGLQYPIEEDINQVFPNTKNQPKSILELFRDGAKFEDDFPRSLNHFYDPTTGAGLGTGYPSPDWALEDKSDANGQEYSYKQARQYFYDALTKNTKSERDRNFGLTFQTLGQVVHHIQDMAQPQHVRNDAHCDLPIPCLFPGVLISIYNPSLYETYTNSLNLAGRLNFDGYAPVNSAGDQNFLLSPRQFWRTSPDGQSDISQGRGIAEFTNTNFLSAGTNFDTPLYPYPRLADAISHDEIANDLFQTAGLPVPAQCLPPNPTCTMTFYTTRVNDNFRLAASADNPRASTSSIFDQYLQPLGKRAFSLNRFNYDEAQKFLIPRAVAYSAGLINYFFRGRIEAQDAGYTDTGITLRVKNAIDLTQTPQYANETLTSGGKLVVAYEYKLPDAAAPGGFRTEVGSSAPVDLTENLSPGKTSQTIYSFTLPAFPDNATGVKFRLVYRGKSGQEDDAVAAGAFESMSGFLVTPSYTPADGISDLRLIYRIGGKWKLSDATGTKVGSLDWKGWYQNGKPTKVLSWVGPSQRYTTVQRAWIGGASPEIYQNGEVFAVAPGNVLGAALNRSGAEESIIAIVNAGDVDVAYQRPNKKSTSPAYYDAVAEPEGWKEIGRYADLTGMYYGANAWFFNGEGTEAQTMRNIDTQHPERLSRLKVVITASTASFSNLGNLDGIEVTQTVTGRDWQGDMSVCGSGHLDGRLEATQSGSYYVAVDYRDNEQVLATVSGLGSGTLVKSGTYTSTCENNSIKQKTQISSTYSDNFTEELAFGAVRIKLDNRTHQVTSQVDLDAHPFSTEGKINSFGEQRTISEFRLLQLAFVDLRHDLYAGMEFSSPSMTASTTYVAGQGVNDGQFCSQSTQAVRFHHLVSFGAQSITVIDDPQDWSGQACSPNQPGQWGEIATPFAPNPGKTYPGLGPTIITSYAPPSAGSWMVDTEGKLIASQLIPSGTGSFNYLSDGNLETLIPGSGGAPSYFPIGLIK